MKREEKIERIILVSDMRRAKNVHKCCLDHKNQLVVMEGWSYICKKCLRYTFDYSINQYILDRKGREKLRRLLTKQTMKKEKKIIL